MGIYNLERIKSVIRRAEKGEELTIAFLGGSITQGSLATEHKYTYAYRVYRWWCDTFPKAKFNYVNGGIGGTDSYYGVSRAVTDVLMYQPDFVMVDFSVNDTKNEMNRETYEGVIRKLLGWSSHLAVMVLNNIYYDSGVTAQDIHNEVADYYGVPHVSIRETVYRRMKAGEYTQDEITPDGLHPNDKGHGLVADEITKLLAGIVGGVDAAEIAGAMQAGEEFSDAELSSEEFSGAEQSGCSVDTNVARSEEVGLPVPLTANAYEYARRLTIREICPKLSGFRADTHEKMGHLDHFKNGWIGVNAGDSITFELEGSCIGIQYRKTISRPAVRAQAVLDGDVEHPVLLDGNFDEDWGDCLYIQPVLHHGEKKTHTLEITALDDECAGTTPFYLMSIIVA